MRPIPVLIIIREASKRKIAPNRFFAALDGVVVAGEIHEATEVLVAVEEPTAKRQRKQVFNPFFVNI